MTYTEERIELKKITITYLEDGIVENYLKPNQIIDAEDILELQENNRLIAQNIPYTVLVIPGEGATVTKEARVLTASKKLVGIKLAKAFVLKSLAHRIIGNFYITVNKTHLITKIFSDRDKALIWLRKFVDDHKVTNKSSDKLH